METERNPWPALWALVIGFFMILIDTTIVMVANPSIQKGLATDTNSVIWVTSAYLLAYAVPLLVTGRMGDRFGPKRIYLVGLVVFTTASLLCGLAETLPGDAITNLIAFRALQGLGAALMTPQTMAVITRTFAAARRGAAMALFFLASTLPSWIWVGTPADTLIGAMTLDLRGYGGILGSSVLVSLVTAVTSRITVYRTLRGIS